MAIADKRQLGTPEEAKAPNMPPNWRLEQQKQWCERRMRRLYTADKRAAKRHSALHLMRAMTARKRHKFFSWYSLGLLTLVAAISLCIPLYRNRSVVSKFKQMYSSQYQAIVHNKQNYCESAMPLDDLFGHLHANVIGQDAALKQLEQALAQQNHFQSIALVGSSGIGKSLTVRLLREHFPWLENVRTYAWNDQYNRLEEGNFETVRRLLENLAHCGRNLLVIDNMASSDASFVPAINELVISSAPNVTKNSSDVQLLTIIYVFNLNRMLLDEPYEHQLKALQHLPNTTVINYRTFGCREFMKCVSHEAKLARMQLDERVTQEMLDTADVKVSGCKTVRAKVLIYGKLSDDVDIKQP
ncbi:uncharacterized protein LOC115627241 [Scaptodrosophila lebanonensis]|uniref:Uncharacterized protein LOC115627241 n=1 Tax=Drosophila lebanonensis TaxID=7225 RepID=A0A6J2TRQ2_DROLE|nr:uncharacterized protein LOC115627241 [Scaptodrosophila lebanonensis]